MAGGAAARAAGHRVASRRPPRPSRPPRRPGSARRGAAAIRFARGAGFGLGRLVRAVIVVVVLFAVVAAVMGSLIDEGVQRADDFAREFNPPGAQAPELPGADESPSGRTQATLPAARPVGHLAAAARGVRQGDRPACAPAATAA